MKADETKTNQQSQPQERHTGAAAPGAHQESRDHNKHNHQEQSGHKPQKPSPAQEKH